MKWSFSSAHTDFERVRNQWDALNQSRTNHILLDSRFVEPLIRYFGSDQTVLAASEDEPRKGFALLAKNGVASWTTFQPSQAPLGLILFGFTDEEYAGSQELMRAIPGHAMFLSILQQDPDYTSFPSASTDTDLEFIDYIETPNLMMTGTFDEYWESRGRNLKHNLDRQNRRIRDSGERMQVVAERKPDRMASCMNEYGRLESAGWKAEEGTSISENNQQGMFYKEILEAFSQTGEAVVYQLILDDRVVATDLCLRRNGMLVILKTTYDETVEKLSPALLMRRESIRTLYEEGEIRNIEFYGRLRDWHKQWMSGTRTMYHVNLFRHSWVKQTRKLVKGIQNG